MHDQARAIPGFWISLAPFFLALLPMFVLRLLFASRVSRPELRPHYRHSAA